MHSFMQSAFVAVIEAPSAFDLIDGRTEGQALCSALKLAGIPHSYSLAVTRDAFLEITGHRMIAEEKRLGKKPILHLSAHGDKTGIGLADGSTLQWWDLRMQLGPIMNSLPKGPLICMSSCSGAFAGSMAMNDDARPAFWKLVGNWENVSWADCAVAYISFYHRLFETGDPYTACDAMIAASGNSRFHIWDGAELRQSWLNGEWATSAE